MSVFWFILLSLLMAGSLILLVYGFSAPLTQAALVFLYVVLGGQYLGWGSFFAVLTAAVLAEWLEFTAGIRGAVKAKGSRRSAWGAIIGGIAGAIVCSPFLFPVGSLLGSFAGTFGLAFIMEWTAHGKRVGPPWWAPRLPGPSLWGSQPRSPFPSPSRRALSAGVLCRCW